MKIILLGLDILLGLFITSVVMVLILPVGLIYLSGSLGWSLRTGNDVTDYKPNWLKYFQFLE